MEEKAGFSRLFCAVDGVSSLLMVDKVGALPRFWREKGSGLVDKNAKNVKKFSQRY